MSKIKNSGLDQYGGEPFEQEQFGTAGVEGVKVWFVFSLTAAVMSNDSPHSAGTLHRPDGQPRRLGVPYPTLLVPSPWAMDRFRERGMYC